MQTWDRSWTDAELYKKYGITKDEIAFIEQHDPSRWARTMSKTIEEILAPKPEARPRIYAYSIADEAHEGLLKVGQTTRDVKQRVAEQLKTAAIKNYTIELDEPAERDDGTLFTDHEVRAALVKKRLREHRTGVDALLGQGREDRAHRAAHRASGSPARITRRSRCAGSRPRR